MLLFIRAGIEPASNALKYLSYIKYNTVFAACRLLFQLLLKQFLRTVAPCHSPIASVLLSGSVRNPPSSIVCSINVASYTISASPPRGWIKYLGWTYRLLHVSSLTSTCRPVNYFLQQILAVHRWMWSSLMKRPLHFVYQHKQTI